MRAVTLPRHHKKKQIVQKNLPPLKIKIPNKSKAKCEKEKPACQEKGKKRKNKELENEEEENKGFHIDGNMVKLLEHLDQHTRDLFQNTKEILDQNLPIIYNSLATVKSFISLLGKIIKKILHKIDPISCEITLKYKGCLLHCPQNWNITSLIDPISCEITLKYKGCLLHCPQNWNITSLPGQLPSDSIKKKKK